MAYDPIRYETDAAYRRQIEGARKGGRAKVPGKGGWRPGGGRPRKDGLPPKAEDRWREAEVGRMRELLHIDKVDERMTRYGWRLDQEIDCVIDAPIVSALWAGVPGMAGLYKKWCEGGKLDCPPPASDMVEVARLRVAGLAEDPRAWDDPAAPGTTPASPAWREAIAREAAGYKLKFPARYGKGRPGFGEKAPAPEPPAAASPGAGGFDLGEDSEPGGFEL